MQDLPFQTITQFVALGLTLIAGWFLGLASSSGGRKWRERYYDEELSSAGYRDRAESDLRDAAQRIRDLEAENARLRTEVDAARESAPAVVPAPVAAPVAIAAPAPVAAEPEGHSTATVVGAAVAGAVAGAAVTHAVEQHDEPRPATAALPPHAGLVEVDPVRVDTVQAEPVHVATDEVHHNAPVETHHSAPPSVPHEAPAVERAPAADTHH